MRVAGPACLKSVSHYSDRYHAQKRRTSRSDQVYLTVGAVVRKKHGAFIWIGPES